MQVVPVIFNLTVAPGAIDPVFGVMSKKIGVTLNETGNKPVLVILNTPSCIPSVPGQSGNGPATCASVKLNHETGQFKVTGIVCGLGTFLALCVMVSVPVKTPSVLQVAIKVTGALAPPDTSPLLPLLMLNQDASVVTLYLSVPPVAILRTVKSFVSLVLPLGAKLSAPESAYS